jgi:hypothetical protein
VTKVADKDIDQIMRGTANSAYLYNRHSGGLHSLHLNTDQPRLGASPAEATGLMQWLQRPSRGYGYSSGAHTCRHRNAVADPAGEPPLDAALTGPGPAEAIVREGGNSAQTGAEAQEAAVEVLCTARTAGDYVLSVFHLETGERLFGSPFAVRTCLILAIGC